MEFPDNRVDFEEERLQLSTTIRPKLEMSWQPSSDMIMERRRLLCWLCTPPHLPTTSCQISLRPSFPQYGEVSARLHVELITVFVCLMWTMTRSSVRAGPYDIETRSVYALRGPGLLAPATFLCYRW